MKGGKAFQGEKEIGENVAPPKNHLGTEKRWMGKIGKGQKDLCKKGLVKRRPWG